MGYMESTRRQLSYYLIDEFCVYLNSIIKTGDYFRLRVAMLDSTGGTTNSTPGRKQCFNFCI